MLEACAQTETIGKIVFTSSATGIFWRDDHNSTTSDFDERHWSDVNFCRKYKVPISSFFPPLSLLYETKISHICSKCTAVACPGKDAGGEDGVGVGDGQGVEHGDYQWRIADES